MPENTAKYMIVYLLLLSIERQQVAKKYCRFQFENVRFTMVLSTHDVFCKLSHLHKQKKQNILKMKALKPAQAQKTETPNHTRFIL